MPPDIVIRRATESDCAAINALYAELDTYHRLHRPDLFRAIEGPARADELLKGVIAGPDSVIVIAERDGALLGLSAIYARILPANAIRPERRYAEIDSFGLTESARRLGIGRRLMQASEAWARQKGMSKLELQVHGFNRGHCILRRRWLHADDASHGTATDLGGQLHTPRLTKIWRSEAQRSQRNIRALDSARANILLTAASLQCAGRKSASRAHDKCRPGKQALQCS